MLRNMYAVEKFHWLHFILIIVVYIIRSPDGIRLNYVWCVQVILAQLD